MDEWIGRNILKIESELEYNNPFVIESQLFDNDFDM
jgi:hypothetical protein